ncbi:hypothetical protein OROGR_002836 [Orobanche gracilis]
MLRNLEIPRLSQHHHHHQVVIVVAQTLNNYYSNNNNANDILVDRHPWSCGYRSHFSSWAFAIRNAASSSSSPLKPLQLYTRMQRQSVPFDTFSTLFALKSCTHLPHNLNIIRHLHAHLLKLGFSTNVYVATCLLSAYASTSFNDVCILFDEMPARNTVTWNVMITGYSRRGDTRAARIAFDVMPL